MSYAVPSDLDAWIDNDRLIRLTDDNGQGMANTVIMQAVLDSASAKMDGLLGGRYELPFAAPVPAILKSICVDIGGYYLHIRREEAPGTYWQKQYDDAIAFLTSVAAGDVGLGVGDPEGTGAQADMAVDAADKLFPRDELAKY